MLRKYRKNGENSVGLKSYFLKSYATLLYAQTARRNKERSHRKD